jgi:hypothetical protein
MGLSFYKQYTEDDRYSYGMRFEFLAGIAEYDYGQTIE